MALHCGNVIVCVTIFSRQPTNAKAGNGFEYNFVPVPGGTAGVRIARKCSFVAHYHPRCTST